MATHNLAPGVTGPLCSSDSRGLLDPLRGLAAPANGFAHLFEVDAFSVSTVVAVARGADDIHAMDDVFLSYSREDRERLAPLVEFLEANGFSVFWDRDIRPGSTWRSVPDAELGQAKCARRLRYGTRLLPI